MSRYFSRLAQRSGLVSPKVSAPAASASAADIVTQDAYVDAAPIVSENSPNHPSIPAAVPIAAPVVPRTAETTNSSRLVRPPVSPASPVPITKDSPRVSRETETSFVLDEQKSFIETHTFVDAPKVEAIKDASSPTAMIKSTIGAGIPLGITEAVSLPTAQSEEPFRLASQRESKKEIAQTSLARVRSDMAEIVTRMESASEDSFVPAPKAKSRVVRDSFVPTSVESVAISSAPVSPMRLKPSDSLQPPTKPDVEVHIGAVRVELHAPTPTPPALAARPMVQPETPRFSARRHYLRG